MNRKSTFLMLFFFFSLSTGLLAQNNLGVEKPSAIESQLDVDIISHKARWDTLRTFQLYNQYDVSSIVSNGDHFYTATWDTNWFFKHEMHGPVVEAFQIDGVKYMRDMTFVPSEQHFFGVRPESSVIYEMNFYNHTLVRTIPIQCAGVSDVRHISYDGALDNGKGGFWIGGYANMGAVDMEGHQLVAGNEILGSWANTYCYGTAYDRSDFYHPKLWLTCIYFLNGDTTKPVPFIKAFDIETRTLADEIYEIDHTGMIDWQTYKTYGGGACAYTDAGITYLATVFQIGEHYDRNLAVVFELAKVGIEEQDAEKRTPTLMPNPVKDQCVLALNGFDAKEVKVYDAIGKLVFTQSVHYLTESSITLDMKALQSGIYTVSISNLKDAKTIKILKQ